jgi:hypothetical protein
MGFYHVEFKTKNIFTHLIKLKFARSEVGSTHGKNW